MSLFRINGGKQLHGTVAISGSKNAVLPILAATLLTDEPCILRNVPRIKDVERLLELLASLGVTHEWTSEHDLRVVARDAHLQTLDRKTFASLRGSLLLWGSLVTRFRDVTIPEAGGDIIGNRPIDAHLSALQQLGATIERQDGLYHFSAPNGFVGALVILPEFSVTATEIALMAAVRAKGQTVIKIAAAEPHVQDLALFLQEMGAKIAGAGTHTLTIQGVSQLHGADHTVIPDQIEVGTFAVAAAVTGGDVLITNIVADHVDLVRSKLHQIGVKTELTDHSLHVTASFPLRSFRLQTFPYPGFPTDLQAPFGVLATQCSGTSLIHDPMYEGRLGYVSELIKMGANAIICDPHRVLVTGPTPLHGQEVKSLDIRAGATLLIAGLIADGETIIHDAEVLDRGYEKFEERLRNIGAEITRE
ncbi:MAG: UDP-N-acetylglucosamine 1-carboxyvinyltransferase [bacterium]|nr:UDP-N-acetylglucosamine 1-carboxyvinyltransferase [bacterium]